MYGALDGRQIKFKFVHTKMDLLEWLLQIGFYNNPKNNMGRHANIHIQCRVVAI